MVIQDFWQGRKVCITGHTGFKGSWLSILLKRLGAEISGISLSSEPESMYTLSGLASSLDSHTLDIRDYEKLSPVLKKINPEVIFHMAAQPLVRVSYDNPRDTFATNVSGLLNVLEIAKDLPSLQILVNVTSDKCYQNQEWHWGYREIDRLGGIDPYSCSKACAELISESYRSIYFNPKNKCLLTARAGNVIGGGDFSRDRLIPDIVRAVDCKKPVQLRYPNSVRPWQHVLDPLAGYVSLVERFYDQSFIAPQDGAWNFGPSSDDHLNVKQVVRRFLESYGCDNHPVEELVAEQPHESHILKLDVSKAFGRLQWKPVWSIERSIRETAEWFSAYKNGKDMKVVTEDQLDKFLEQ
jgi:CDP-glucose 4,6-dehydratase